MRVEDFLEKVLIEKLEKGEDFNLLDVAAAIRDVRIAQLAQKCTDFPEKLLASFHETFSEKFGEILKGSAPPLAAQAPCHRCGEPASIYWPLPDGSQGRVCARCVIDDASPNLADG